MWLRNSLLALLFPALLTGCGFKPLYGNKDITGNPDSRVFAGVRIDPIPGGGRMAQQFKINLEDKLNPTGAVPPNPTYRLTATLRSQAAAIGIARDGTVSRYNVYLDSEYGLYRVADGQKVTSGNIRHVSSYNNLTNAYFSTYISEQDAVKRGVEELAEVYRSRLAVYLEEGGPQQATVNEELPLPQPIPTPHPFLGQGTTLPVPKLK